MASEKGLVHAFMEAYSVASLFSFFTKRLRMSFLRNMVLKLIQCLCSYLPVLLLKLSQYLFTFHLT